MDKTEAIKLILKISNECEDADKCNHCAFYNLVDAVEGCVFDKLLYQEIPKYFRKTIGK